MTEQVGHLNNLKSVESQIDETSDNQESFEKHCKVDNDDQSQETQYEIDDSLIEQSYEVISKLNSMDTVNESDVKNSDIQVPKTCSEVVDNKTSRSNSESLDDANIELKKKKSGSFLSKLQTSISNEKEPGSTSNNIPSSIASAFSSFSTFTSSFNLNSQTNGNNNPNSLTIETASTSTKASLMTDVKEHNFTKKATLERKNLLCLTKLIVKDLISSSLMVSRTIDDCQNAVHLNNYFTLIDRVLKHGLKQNLLSTRSASLWNALDSLQKYLKESNLMSESVRSLPNTKTPDGKIKAWMRLAMMQKRLPEYFSELLANKDVLLKDIYHEYAFMLNDEAHVFAGLIIGVNVIDCNFFVKDDNFDVMDHIIDLSPYLRVANSYDSDQDDDNFTDIQRNAQAGSITAVLDQKNYLEEWNKRLESTVSELQAKIKNLEEQNSKLEMEIKLSEVRISKLQRGKPQENSHDKHSINFNINNSSSFTEALKSLIGTSENKHSESASVTSIATETSQTTKQAKSSDEENSQPDIASPDEIKEENQINELLMDQGESVDDKLKSSISQTQSTTESDLKKKISEQEHEFSSLKERASILEASYRSALEKIKILERDLDVQTSINADKDTTIKIYEKDIKEKNAQVESLRTSLSDMKKLNSSLSERLNEASNKMKERVHTIQTLQDSLSKWKIENKTLATRYQDKQTAYKSIAADLEKTTKNMEDLKKYNEKINEELRKERESGQSSSVTVETQTAQINELTGKLFRMENELNDIKPYKEQTDELNQKCRDYEQSLEEIGAQLRESRLEVENLKENSAVFLDSQWMDSKQIKSCTLCQQLFSVTRRKHHCRLCGNVFCQTCSDNKMELASSSKPVRVCDTCHGFLLAKFVKSGSS